MKIDSHEFPCYFVDSDRVSLRSQQLYKWANYLILIVLFIATVLCSIDALRDEWPVLNKIAGTLLLVTTTGSMVLLIIKPEKGWYNGRAVAESIKTSSWKYMMGSANDQDFIRKVESIIVEARSNNFKLTKTYSKHRDVITKQMTAIRSLSFDERKDTYITERIDDQIKWYTKKSKENARMALVFGSAIGLFQLAAGVYLLFFIDSFHKISPIEILVFLTTAAVSLLELNRHKELSQSYGLTAIDLNLIRARFGSVRNDRELEQFAEDAENAISREHTMWLARKRT